MELTTTLIEKKITKYYWQTPVSVVGWIAADNIIYASAQGFISGERYRKGCMAMLQAIREKKSKKIFNNLLHMQITPAEDQQWMTHTFLPLLLREAPLCMAYVYPESAFAQLTLKKIQENAPACSSPVTSNDFSDETDAYRWLKSVKL